MALCVQFVWWIQEEAGEGSKNAGTKKATRWPGRAKTLIADRAAARTSTHVATCVSVHICLYTTGATRRLIRMHACMYVSESCLFSRNVRTGCRYSGSTHPSFVVHCGCSGGVLTAREEVEEEREEEMGSFECHVASIRESHVWLLILLSLVCRLALLYTFSEGRSADRPAHAPMVAYTQRKERHFKLESF